MRQTCGISPAWSIYIGVERCVLALHRLGKDELLADYEMYLDHENYNAYVYDKTTK